MKRGKTPTAAQKKVLSSAGYDPSKWVIKEWGQRVAVITHRDTKEVKTLNLN